MVTIKSEREIELMREAGKILAKVHEELGKAVKPGISTKEIDRICEEMIRSYGCIPSFLGYEGYPASVCISINDEVVHGIPNKHRYLNEGDIVSLAELVAKVVAGAALQSLAVLHQEGISVRRSKNSHDRRGNSSGQKAG